ncbi:coiled-coil domain-containing protein 57 isoform X2 [Desmodus rotundus]|nr:coiled-coil domain-containing protein 57 isoform X2 [Desmodus rotundus]XP_053766825.1 coiled-coil domain-containing protein 57 isoform X2 [Desmodus rotundus]XP_053766826.1 coiled-coil domain-containing protein 57 isoform X2 [Desmodus rotundus]
MPPPPSEQALSELLARKEEEWRALQAQRSRLQEAALQEAHSRLAEAQSRLQRLQEDFVYNLQVLEERDRELEHYDAAFAQARLLEEARQAEVSELKVEAAKLRQALAREAQRLEDLQQQQQRKEQEHRLALQQVHSDKNGEIDQQREQYEKLKWKLERKLEELDGHLALQRQELLLEFESEMQKREQAFQLHADSVSGVVLAHELKVKLLNEELAALREAGAQAAESLQSAQATSSELEDRLQRAAWELRDLAAMKDARIKDLEGRLQSVQMTRKKEEETFKRKHEELDRTARERDAVLASVKDAHAEQLRELEARVLEVQAQCEALELQARRAEWRQADALKERDAAIAKLREEASTLRSGWDAQVAQLSKEVTSRDLRVQSLQEEEAELQAQLARCQQDIGRYQRQLSLAAEREQSLQRDKVQLGLDWQRRCAGLERDHYRQSEELIQGLTMAREQVAAKLQEAERKLHDQEVVLKAVTLERDQALRTHGLLPEQELQGPPGRPGEEASSSFPSGEIRRLQEQNASLRDAVARMRTQMEALSEQGLPPTQPAGDAALEPQPDAQPATPDYVLALEAEIRNLKCKFKTLEEQLGDVPEPRKVPSSQSDAPPSVPPAAEASGDTTPPNSVSLGLALRRLGDRTRLLNLLVVRLRQQVLQEPLEVDVIQHVLPHEVDQVHLEMLELQRQVAELEKHLGTARQGGREPPSRWQLHGPNRVALGGQVAAAGGPAGTEDPGAPPPQVPSVQQLQRKLKEAARVALRLQLEKEQLLELGNRLRAELGRPAGKPRHPCPSPEARNPAEGPETPSERGPPLKQLQPHLTTQVFPRQDWKNPAEGRAGETPPHQAPAVRRNDAPLGPVAGTAGLGQKPHKISTVTCKSTNQKENRSPEPRQAHGLLQGSGHHTQRSSSLASSSLQDTWKLLDLGSSPSGLASQDDSTPLELTAPAAADSLRHTDESPTETQETFAIKGVKMEAQAKAKPARPPRAHPVNPKRCQRAPKIRNYNFKD